ncbi:TlpA disulfide reductase family protein [Chitinophaga rhizophila]|uniref:AhpC/TSA family protein n=1 Tax=Chitinophaga rhizophila TaxID=2866212 RepID=A0ABS7GA22_9BACT|nr:TlpA disulfide reductase family protein [Chitinophaga rhizophila]MBW8684503.1 AhpC/TSA family protein [Chitinophaga rhizophila]
MNRILMFLVACLISMPMFAQTTFYIRGQLGKLPAPAKVYIGYSVDGEVVYDSADIEKGTFKIVQQTPYPVNAMLMVSKNGEPVNVFNSKNLAHMYVEPGASIWLTSDEDIANFESNGCKTQDEYVVYQTHMSEINAKIDALTAESSSTMFGDGSAAGLSAKKNYMERFRTAMDERRTMMKEFIQQYPELYISIDVLDEYAGAFIEFAEIEPLYKILSDRTKKTIRGKAFLKRLLDAKQAAVGTEAPDFTQKDQEGNKVTLSSFKGKVVLLNFWGSWNPASRIENQELKQTVKSFDNKKLVVINVGIESRRNDWNNAISEDKLTGYNVSDLKFMRSETAQLYKITTVPQNVLIDETGKIIARNLKGSQLEEKLKSLLGN